MTRCRYHDFAVAHGYQVERCPYERARRMPYCPGHLRRVAWLVLSPSPRVIRLVPTWVLWAALVVLAVALCPGGSW